MKQCVMYTLDYWKLDDNPQGQSGSLNSFLLFCLLKSNTIHLISYSIVPSVVRHTHEPTSQR